MKATQLGSAAIRSCLSKVNVNAEAVEEVFMGCVLQVKNFLKRNEKVF